jgi:hypothetical protein
VQHCKGVRVNLDAGFHNVCRNRDDLDVAFKRVAIHVGVQVLFNSRTPTSAGVWACKCAVSISSPRGKITASVL